MTESTAPTEQTTPDPVTAEPLAAPAIASAADRRPRIRVAAIVWGLLLAALGAGVVLLASDPANVDGLAERVVTASNADAAIAGLIVLIAGGGVILLGALLRAIRRRQER